MTDNLKPEILPCPFCNSDATLLWAEGMQRKTWYVECVNEECCSKPGYSRKDKDEAIAAWNKRAESEPSKAEPVAYGDRLGTYYASVHIAPKGALPQWMQHMTPLYSAPPSAQTGAQDHIAQASKMVTQSTYPHDVSKSAGEIDLSDAEIMEVFDSINRNRLTNARSPWLESVLTDFAHALLGSK